MLEPDTLILSGELVIGKQMESVLAESEKFTRAWVVWQSLTLVEVENIVDAAAGKVRGATWFK